MHRLNWRTWSLGPKLTLVVTILIFVTVTSTTVLSILREQQNFHAEQEQQVKLMLNTLSASAVDHLYFLRLGPLADIVERVGENPAVVVARFYDPSGRIIADAYDRALTQSPEADPFGRQLVASDEVVFEWYEDRLVAGQAVIVEGQRLGAVSVGLSTASLAVKVATVRNQGLSVALVAVTIGILLAVLFNRSIILPLHHLVMATERIASGDLTQQVTVRGSSEFAILAEAFNHMRAQLRAMIDQSEHHTHELEQRSRELLALQAAGTSIASSLEFQLVLEAVAHEMMHLLKAAACAIFKWNHHTDTISLLFEFSSSDWGGEKSLAEIFSSADHPAISRVLVMRRAEQIMIDPSSIDPTEPASDKPDKNDVLILPMTFQGRVAGLTILAMKQDEEPVPDRQIVLAKLLANQAAGAIENAHLYQDAQQEINERKQVEQKIKTSLREKEILLKEIHHRVKNNLQIISSLLMLQSEDTSHEQVIKTLRESQNRIRSMAIIHETLYQSRDLAQVDFAKYTLELIDYLLRSYTIDEQSVTLKMDIPKIFLSIDTTIYCGLIINELVSNSLKYAFPEGRKGEICIGLQPDHRNQLTLTVSDNGVGLPPDLELHQVESLGLQLVTMLTEQLEGSIEFDRRNGTVFKIMFSLG